MTGFEPMISGVRSNRSTNCVTTTANRKVKYNPQPVEFRFMSQLWSYFGKAKIYLTTEPNVVEVLQLNLWKRNLSIL